MAVQLLTVLLLAGLAAASVLTNMPAPPTMLPRWSST
jgi:hypothetical protein